MIEQLIPFITASVLLTLSPGPDIVYVLVQGMTNGKKYGIITSFGLVSGIVVHTTLVAFGVSAIISQSEMLFWIIKFLGACYLFYLAYQVYKSHSEIELSTDRRIQKQSFWFLFKRGFLMNVLNPKVIIFFLAFFPGFLWEPAENTVIQFYILGAVFIIQAFLIFSLISLLAGRISDLLRTHPKSGIVFKWLQIAVFLGIGFFILL